MATELPVRIEFALPDGWRPVPPDKFGAPGVAFVAVHSASADDFTANLMIAGQFRDPALSMPDIADESVRRLSAVASPVRIRERKEVGSADAPGMTQVLDLRAGSVDLVQYQVYVSMHDVDDPARRAVLELMLTCTHAQVAEIYGDFDRFVRTVRPVAPSR